MPREHPRPGQAQARALLSSRRPQDARASAGEPTPAPAADRAPARAPAPRAGVPRGSLPDGASFHARYNAALRRFEATLTLATGRAFTSRADGVYAAIRQLYGQYYQWAAGGGPPDELT